MRIKTLIREPAPDLLAKACPVSGFRSTNSLSRYSVRAMTDSEVSVFDTSEWLPNTACEYHICMGLHLISDDSDRILYRHDAEYIEDDYGDKVLCYGPPRYCTMPDPYGDTVAISDCNTYLAFAYIEISDGVKDGMIDIWNLIDMKVIGSVYLGGGCFADALRFDPSGKTLLARVSLEPLEFSWVEDEPHGIVQSIGIREFMTGQKPRPNDSVPILAFVDVLNGQQLDSEVACWDYVATPNHEIIVTYHNTGISIIHGYSELPEIDLGNSPSSISITSDGKLAAVSIKDTIQLIDLSSATICLDRKAREGSTSMCFRDEDELLVRQFEDGTLEAWRLHREPWSIDSLRAMSPLEFEEFVLGLFQSLDWNVEHTPCVADGGKDGIIAKGDKRLLVECKRFGADQMVGSPMVSQFLGAITDEGAAGGYYVTTGRFTVAARDLAERNGIVLWDQEELVRVVREVL